MRAVGRAAGCSAATICASISKSIWRRPFSARSAIKAEVAQVLPFELTGAQKRVIKEITADMARPVTKASKVRPERRAPRARLALRARRGLRARPARQESKGARASKGSRG